MNEPKSGVYLDATLSIISDRVENRIDDLQRRRHRGWIAAIFGLVLVAAAGGSAVAAVLLTPGDVPKAVVATEVQQVQCIASSHLDMPAYFGTRFSSSPELSADAAVAVCEKSRTAIAAATQEGSISNLASTLLREELGSDSQVAVESAYIGPLPRAAGREAPPMAVCLRATDNAKFVISADAGERAVSRSEWSRRCALTSGFDLAGGER